MVSSQSTPKFAFMTWLSIRDIMSTLDRVGRWSQGLDTTCVLCKNAMETRCHLFFECAYTAQVWEYTPRGIMRSFYTNRWSEILLFISDEKRERMSLFCIRYAFQSVLYAVWRERNKIMHGEKLMPLPAVMKMIDKGIRNKITLMSREEIKGMEKLMQYWFHTRV